MSKPSKQEMIAYLCNIYESLYPFCKEQQLPPDLVDKLVYSPPTENKSSKIIKNPMVISSSILFAAIQPQPKRQGKTDSGAHREYENPFHINSKEDVERVLNSNQSLSKKDLLFMYKVVFGIPYSGNGTKQDIMLKIQDYYVSQSRTADLMKNLY